MDDGNRVIVEAWNTVLFDKFVRFRPLVVDALAQFSDAALRQQPYRPGERVLDIGCGFGDSTQRIAAQVAPHGEAVGV
jgi:ubiquinone/menaquinone biosynthesis C-methylase UbiE